MNSLTDLISYFKNGIAENHVDLKYFCYGVVDTILKMISDSRSTIEYPCLLFETPSYKITGEANQIMKPSFAFTVLDKTNQGDYENQNQIIDSTIEIVLEIWQKIKRDSKAREVGFRVNLEKEYSIDMVQPPGPDYLIGWRMEVELIHPRSNCFHPEKWKNL